MPGMDGWAVLAALKADAATADIPVVMVTIVDDRNLGYALGAADYLTKPIDRERLVAVLAQHRPRAADPRRRRRSGVRELLRRTLEREGYAVLEADDGRAALARLRERLPGLILLDLMMPHMDGFELVEPSCARGRAGAASRSSWSPPRTSRPRTGSASTATSSASSRRARTREICCSQTCGGSSMPPSGAAERHRKWRRSSWSRTTR